MSTTPSRRSPKRRSRKITTVTHRPGTPGHHLVRIEHYRMIDADRDAFGVPRGKPMTVREYRCECGDHFPSALSWSLHTTDAGYLQTNEAVLILGTSALDIADTAVA